VTPPTAFLPATQPPRGSEAQEFVIRTTVPPATLIPTIQRAILGITDQLPLRFQTLDDQVTDSIARERVLAALGVIFGGIALLLAVIGLYGVLSYFVAQQQIEFGIRMAIGAVPAAILRLVLRDVFVVLSVGVFAGTALALAAAPLLSQLLFDLRPRDTWTLAGAVSLLVVTALLAAYLPARRATRVDPLIALRAE
jgi:ABC-type antimicrobial peptide transport system permease subunit